MNDSETYCRLCAKLRQQSKLIDLQADVEKCREVIIKLTRLNANMNFNGIILPKTVCFVCLDLLESAYDFVTAVERAQLTLNDFMLVDIKNEMNLMEDAITYETPVVKPEDEICIKNESDIEDCSMEVTRSPDNSNNCHNNTGLDSTDEDIPLNYIKQEKYLCKRKTKPKKTKNKSDILFNSHSKSLTEVASTWKEFSWKCCLCKTDFPSANDLVTHSIQTHDRCNPFQCTVCNSKKYRLDLFIKHIHRIHNQHLKLSCYKCYETFPTIKSTFRHCVTHKSSSYICPGCNTCFPNENELKCHCDTYYRTPRDLNNILEGNADGLTCLKCNKSFKGKYHLTNHLIRQHLEVRKDQICELCGNEFRTVGELQDHMLTHTDVRPFKCKFCMISFKSEDILRRHVNLHDGQDFPCDKCGKTFKRQFYLKRHHMVHTDVMPWKCNICDKLFKRKEFLNRHLRLHSGEKPYSCDICIKAYVDWPNYNKHMKTLHGRDMSKTKRTPYGVFRVDLKSGELIKPEVDKEIQDWREKLKLEKGKRRRAKPRPIQLQ